MRRLAIGLAFSAVTAYGASTAAWEMNTYQDFMRGKFAGLSMSREGQITLSPKLDSVFQSGQPYVWSVVSAADGTVYLGTGHRGKVFKVTKDGQSSLYWTSPQPEIFALAAGPDGTLFAGTSPNGKVYKIVQGVATEYFSPGATYIWSLAYGADGSLYVGTGDNGKIFKVTAPQVGEVYYETGQSHVTCLAFDREKRLLAGSEPNGLLYRISAKDRAFVLYDANLPEIRSLTLGPDGAIYVAAMGGSLSQRTAAAASAAPQPGGSTVTAPTTTITVTSEAQAGGELKPGAAPAAPTPVPAATGVPAIELSGVEKSAIYRISDGDTVDTLWSSKEENTYDVLADGASVLFATDANGRIYRLDADRKATLVAQTGQGETTRLISSSNGMLAATGTMGILFRLGSALMPEGTYESPVHDAGASARWGQLTWRGESLNGTKLAFRTRSGNSARPDGTWSEWSAPLQDPRNGTIESPRARYVQWKAELASSGSQSPSLTNVTLSYLPQNTTPVVRSITVSTQLAASSAVKPAVQPSSAATYSITVTDTGEAGASSVSGTSAQNVSPGLSHQIQLIWTADDADGDRLVYSIYFRGEDETQWKLLRGNYTETTLVLEGDVLADGKYFFRVAASDKPVNPAATAREAELISAPVIFDRTPPAVTVRAQRQSTSAELRVEASDAASHLRRAEYSLDAAAWVPLEPSDGIVDGQMERFQLKLDGLSAGEHLVVVRVYDASNNAGLAKTVIR